jgi:2-polyprenyl-3-methyl-5-hydroxy-6-metoxy-1,4-benzoquinol methylase
MNCPLCASGQLGPFARLGAREYLECQVCRLVHLSPKQRLSAEAERRFYEMHENSPADQRYRAFLNRLAEPLARHLTRGARGLDYGCGPGPTLSVMLEERGFSVEVYDPFFANHLTVLERTYDFITCSESAEHFFTPGKEFAALNTMLRPAGWIGVMTAMRSERRHFETWHYARDPTHVSFYCRATLRWIAASFGWEVLFPERNVALFHKLPRL